MSIGSLNLFDRNFISEDHLKSIPYDSAFLTTSNFDPQNPDISNIKILCPTTGDINVSSTFSINNLAEDINNLHGQPIELQQMGDWTHSLTFTALGTTPDIIKMSLSATTTGEDGGIIPKSYLSPSDFSEKPLWIICMQIGGGMFAVKFERYLSTAGLNMTTTKAGKGTSSITINGFNSIKNMNASPVTYYPISARFTVAFDMQGHGTAIESQVVKDGEKATQPTNPTATGYTFGGWYKDTDFDTEWDFAKDVVESDVTLFAKWTEN